ncbi:GGDEF domain-containing protein [Mangrovicella endophytica]|uniref:GGDEF domain-containing protein n=1 Tax=Mangrovicella endophytica TaxID=2066697 RepID=UPI000C9E06B1|nr:GGDEF domain-containing protein [Mangrovicella endophytica]
MMKRAASLVANMFRGEIRSERELAWNVVRIVACVVVAADLLDAGINLLTQPDRVLPSLIQTSFTAGVMAAAFGYWLSRANLRLFQTKFQLEVLSRVDAQTGLMNRRTFIEASERQIADGAATVLIVADIDRFKQINDRFGHPVGDVVIAGVGEALAACFPNPHLTGRIGGEEFAVLFVGGTADKAHEETEGLRRRVAAANMVAADPSFHVTISAGLCELASRATLAESYAAADNALYCAKHLGRNRVVEAGDPLVRRLDGVRRALSSGQGLQAP